MVSPSNDDNDVSYNFLRKPLGKLSIDLCLFIVFWIKSLLLKVDSSISGSGTVKTFQSLFFLNTLVTTTYSLTFCALYSEQFFLPLIPIKTKPYLYYKFQISFEPILVNHFFAYLERWVVHSSWHAATTIWSSAISCCII